MSACNASLTSPCPAPFLALSSSTSSPASRSGSDTAFASSSTSGGLRKLVSRPNFLAGGKSSTNRGRFAALAPRQP